MKLNSGLFIPVTDKTYFARLPRAKNLNRERVNKLGSKYFEVALPKNWRKGYEWEKDSSDS